ncbi:unnamed protein product [Aspergillus oryzae]|nr:unnamed protein product [Aspergillus oryzae]GMF93701.1 unnamed protein product [Aspergillus oryzae]
MNKPSRTPETTSGATMRALPHPSVFADVSAYVRSKIPATLSAMPSGSKRLTVLWKIAARLLVRACCWPASSSLSGDATTSAGGRSGRGRMKNAAGIMTPDRMRDIQKIHRQPTYAVKTPPKIRPILVSCQQRNERVEVVSLHEAEGS